MKLDERRPRAIALALPAEVAGDEVRCAFAFDLAAAAGGGLSGTYQAYLVLGEAVSGPHPITIGAP